MQAPQKIPQTTDATADSWHQREVHELTTEHAVDPEHGLQADEVARRMAIHGPNELPSVARRGPLALFAAQFTDFMVLVLLVVTGGVLVATACAGATARANAPMGTRVASINAG